MFGKTIEEMKQASSEGQKFGGLFTKSVVQPFANAESVITKYNLGLEHNSLTQSGFQRLLDQSDESLGNYLKGLNGTPAKMQGYSASLNTAKASTIGLKLSTIALNAALTMGIAIALQFAVEGIMHLVHAQQEAIDKANELTSTYKSSTDEIKSNKSTLEGLSDEYKTLSKGVDENGKNVGLTAEQYKRYHEIVKQIVGISPSLIKGYDGEGNALVKNNTLIEDAISLQKKLNEQKKAEYLAKGSDILSGANGDIGKSQNNLSKLGTDLIGEIGLDSSLDATIAKFKKLGLDYQKLIQPNRDIGEMKKAVGTQEQLIEKLRVQNNLTDEEKVKIKETIGLIDIELGKVDAGNQKKIDYLNEWSNTDSNPWFNQLSSSGFMTEFDSALKKMTEDNPSASIEELEVKTKALGTSFVDIQDQIPTDKIADLKKQLADGKITNEQFNQSLTTQIDSICELADSYSKSNPVLSEFLKLIAKGYTDFANTVNVVTPFESMTSSLSSFDSQAKTAQKSISDLATDLKTLNTTIDENQKGTLLDGDAVADLIFKYPELADKIIDTGKGYKFESGALEEVRKAQIAQQEVAIKAQIATAQQTLDSTKSRLKNYVAEIGAINSLAEAQNALAKLNSNTSTAVHDPGFDHNSQEYKDYMAKQREIKQTVAAYASASSEIEAAQQKIDALEKGLTLVGSNNYQKADNSKEKTPQKEKYENEALKAAEALLAYRKNMGEFTSDDLEQQIYLNEEYVQGVKNLEQYAKTEEELRDINVKVKQAQDAVIESQEKYQKNILDTSFKELDTRKKLHQIEENSGAELQNLLEIQQNLVSGNLDLINTDENRLTLQEKIYDVQKAMQENDKENINNLNKTAVDMLKQKYDDEKQYHEDKINHIKDESKAEQDALDKELNTIKEKIKLQKEALNKQKSDRSHQQELAEKEKSVSDLKSKITVIGNDTSDPAIKAKLALENELAEKTKALDDFKFDYEIQQQQDALDNSESNYEKEYQNKKELLEKSEKDEEALQQKKIDRIEKHVKKEKNLRLEAMDLMNSKSQDFYNDLIAYNNEYGSMVDFEIRSAWDKAYDSLSHYNSGQLDVLSTLEKLTTQMQAYSDASQTSATRNKSSISSDGTYLVKKNDTLSGIADYFGISLAKLKSENGNAESVIVGSKLRIPKYENGTLSAASGLGVVDDGYKKLKEIIAKQTGGRLEFFKGGETVYNGEGAINLNEWSALKPKSILPKIAQFGQTNALSNIIPNHVPVTIQMPINIGGNANGETLQLLESYRKSFIKEATDQTVKAINKTRISSGTTTSVLNK